MAFKLKDCSNELHSGPHKWKRKTRQHRIQLSKTVHKDKKEESTTTGKTQQRIPLSRKTIKQRNQRKSVLDYLVAVNPSIIDEV